MAPIDAPAMAAGLTPSSSKAPSTARWARPRAPPAPRARPMVGASGIEERTEERERVVRRLFGDEMAGAHLSAGDLRREGVAPDVERRLRAARQIELAPHEQRRAGDRTIEGAVLLVLPHVDGGPGA